MRDTPQLTQMIKDGVPTGMSEDLIRFIYDYQWVDHKKYYSKGIPTKIKSEIKKLGLDKVPSSNCYVVRAVTSGEHLQTDKSKAVLSFNLIDHVHHKDDYVHHIINAYIESRVVLDIRLISSVKVAMNMNIFFIDSKYKTAKGLINNLGGSEIIIYNR